MKRILFLNPPGRYLYVRDYFCSKISKADYINAPIDLVMLSGVLNTGEFKLNLIDAIVEKLPVEKCLGQISVLAPDIIIALIGSASLEEDEPFLKKLSEKFSGEIFVIGDFLLTEGKKFLEKNTFIKGVISNFVSDGIYQYLKGKEDGIVDMIIREGPGIKAYPSSNFKEFRIHLPIHKQFINRNYRMPFMRRRPFATVLASYGCPFKCTFCIMNTFPYAERDIDNLFEELDYLKSLDVKEILFLDQTIGISRGRYLEFLSRMIKNNYGFGWFGFTRVDLVDEEILRLAKKSGCHTLWFGVESASDEILKKYRKGYTKEQILRAFKLSKEIGIKTLATFLLGLPEENKEMIEETIKFSKKLNPDFASFNFAVPRFGTGLRESALDSNLIDGSNRIMDQSGREVTMGTLFLTREDVQKLKRRAILGFYLRPTYILKRVVALKSFTELKMNLRNFIGLIKSVL